MRFLIILLFFPFAGFAQSLLAKPVTLTVKQGTAGDLLILLNEELNGAVSYSSHVINLSAQVKLAGDEKTVANYLATILKGQRVRFVEENNKIFLLPGKPGKKTISGYITEKGSGERLIGASVFFPSLQLGTTTNAYGFFSVTLASDSTVMQVSHIGYEPFQQTLSMQDDRELAIALQPAIIFAEPIVIKSGSRKNVYSTPSGKTNVQPAFIRSLPAMMGEADVLRSLQLLPGIQAGNEGSSGLNVRGGSADQNLILLDGVPVYNASHAFGMFSVFNADVVNHVEVLKTAFPASYGGRLSSVIDVYLKEGDLQQFHGEGGVGLLFSKLTLEGPLKKGRSSFLISGRRTYADLLLKPIIKSTDSESDFSPFFTDLNVKMNFVAGKKDHIYFSTYLGKDNFRVSENASGGTDSLSEKIHYSSGVSWGNLTAMARVNHVFSKKLFSNFTLTHSRYRFNLKNDESHFTKDNRLSFESRQHYFSGIRDWTVKTDVDYLPAPDHYVKTGFSATLHSYRPGVNNFFLRDSVTSTTTRFDNQSSFSGEYDLYLEDDWRVSGKLKMNLGLRMSAFAVKRTLFSSVQPRINILYKPLPEWSFKAAYSTMNQFIHLLTNSSIGLPTDLWLPVTEKLPPQTSNQVSAGAYFRPDPSFDVSMEVYYKALKNVIDYSEDFGFANAYESWETMLETGKGKTYGAEWMVQKTKGKVTGMLGYTLSKSTRKFENINEGKPFAYKYDKRHEIKTSLMWQPSKKFQLSAAWVFSTGNAVSLPVGWYYNPNTYSYVDIYKGRNNFRMPDYHRLDLAFRFIKEHRKYTRTWAFNVYNVYNHFNPFYRYKDFDENNKIVFKDMSLFPFLPSFSYQFKF